MGPYRSLTPLTRSRFGATTARKQLRRHRRNRVPARRWLHAGIRTAEGYQPYFSELLILVNLLFKFVPRPLTTVMIAIEMPAAISPYSIAVAPDWSFRKRAKSLLIGIPQPQEGWSMTGGDCSPVKSIAKKPRNPDQASIRRHRSHRSDKCSQWGRCSFVGRGGDSDLRSNFDPARRFLQRDLASAGELHSL